MIEQVNEKNKPTTSDRFLKTAEVKKILACSRDFLVKLRVEGKLIPIIRSKTNHVYSLNDVERYIQQEKAKSKKHRRNPQYANYTAQDIENLKLIGIIPEDY
jgi:hypothetical protein